MNWRKKAMTLKNCSSKKLNPFINMLLFTFKKNLGFPRYFYGEMQSNGLNTKKYASMI